jgi:predicted permease
MERVPEKQQGEIASRWSAVFQSDRALMASATTDPVAKAAALGGTVQFVSAAQGMGWLRHSYLSPLTLLMGLSISVFLVGCLNLASLQLARLSSRAQELSVRTALGASRWRLLRQVMIEDALLVLLGGAGSFLIGRAASSALLRWASGRGFLLTLNLDLSLPIAALGLGLMITAWIAFSILPALSFMRRGLQHVVGLKSRVSGLAQTRHQRWRSNAMLVSEVGLSLLLATMAGCFAATLQHWEQLDIGMDREHILSVSLAMRSSGYLDQERDLPQLYHRIRERLESAPGIRSAAVEICPLTQCGWVTALYVFGHNGFSEEQLRGEEDHVGPGFFATMGIPLLRGRDFSERDTTQTQSVAILSQRCARQLFGKEDPIGHWIGYEPAPNDHKFLIVGVVADARVDGVRREAPPMVYIPVDQHPSLIQRIQIRATGDPAKLAIRVRDLLRQVDPDLPITEITPLAEEFSDGLGTEKLLTRLAGVYAGLALLLVGIGLYGVLSFRTSRRQGEFGVRLALGATRGHIHLLVMGQTALILAAGIGAGLCLSFVGMHLARHLLYASQTANALAAAGAVVVLVVTGLGAAMMPARRAALADPLETLRQE